ncbi:hypothetical protein ACFCP7_16250 [Paenibacillus elgii]
METPSDEVGEALSGKGITAIGDSVILDAAPFVEKTLPGIVIDGKIGRQMYQAEEVVKKLQAEGKLGDRVILELGTNGSFNTEKLRSLLELLDDARQVFLVNVPVQREWQDSVNKKIAEVANEFSNVTVVDWYSSSEGKDDFFYHDGVHLKPDGGQYYASFLVKALNTALENSP